MTFKAFNPATAMTSALNAEMGESDERRAAVHSALIELVAGANGETAALVLRELGWMTNIETGELGVLDRLSHCVPRRGTQAGSVSQSERLVWARTVGAWPAGEIMAAWDQRDRLAPDAERRPVPTELLRHLTGGHQPAEAGGPPKHQNAHARRPDQHPSAYAVILRDVAAGVRHVCQAWHSQTPDDDPCRLARKDALNVEVLERDQRGRAVSMVLECPVCGGVNELQYEDAA